MCLIIVKKQGVEVPTNLIDYVKQAARTNADGVGIAFKEKGTFITYVLRSLDVEDIIRYIQEKQLSSSPITAADSFFIHFRMGTSGVVSTLNVHPFEIQYSYTSYNTINKSLDNHENWATKMPIKTYLSVAAHNGILSDYSGHPKYCDTLLFTQLILNKKNIASIPSNELGGKWAFYKGNDSGDVQCFGNFVKCSENGLYFSHSGGELRKNHVHY